LYLSIKKSDGVFLEIRLLKYQFKSLEENFTSAYIQESKGGGRKNQLFKKVFISHVSRIPSKRSKNFSL
jgi:hypothetical protein